MTSLKLTGCIMRFIPYIFVGCLILVFFQFISPAHSREVLVSCKKIHSYSHYEVQMGLSLVKHTVGEKEASHLHNRYSHLLHSCKTNPHATTHIKVSPKLASLMSEHGFLH